MQITKHSVATITYTLTDDDGAVIDASEESEPMAYVHGTGSLVPGLESALEGKRRGDAFKIRILPEDAYGERDATMVHDVPRSDLPAESDIQVGMQFQARNEAEAFVVTVTDIVGDKVRLDANHPLAGIPLNFDVKVVDVRSATSEEIQHGHVHGPDDHHH